MMYPRFLNARGARNWARKRVAMGRDGPAMALREHGVEPRPLPPGKRSRPGQGSMGGLPTRAVFRGRNGT